MDLTNAARSSKQTTSQTGASVRRSPVKPEVSAAFPATGVTQHPKPPVKVLPHQIVPTTPTGDSWQDLEIQIARAIAIAWSPQMPDDPPTSTRTLTTRRRAYVQMAALAFANHNPQLRDDDDAGVQAVILATARVVEHIAEGGAPTREVVPVPTPPTPIRQGVVPTPPTPARPVPVPVEDPLLRLVRGVFDRFLTEGRKFVDDDVKREPRLREAAAAWLSTYRGDNEYLKDVRSRLDVRPQFRTGSISVAQARGVLNTWMGIYRASKPKPGK